MTRGWRAIAVLGGALGGALLARPAPAERLPIATFTAADGLAGNEISSILQDSRGFLWIGTPSGLSRFDGSRFLNYGPLQGLPSPSVDALLGTPAGALLVATRGGVARLDPRVRPGGALFSRLPGPPGSLGSPPAGATLLAAGRAAVWLGSQARGGGSILRLGSPEGTGTAEAISFAPGRALPAVTALVADGEELWAGTDEGLWHRQADGRWIPCPLRPGGGVDERARQPERRQPPGNRKQKEPIRGLLIDRHHRLWIAGARGLYVLAPGAGAETGASIEAPACPLESSGSFRLPATPGELCRLDQAAGLAGDSLVGPLLETRDGRVLVPTSGGLSVFDGRRFHTYGVRQGLASNLVTSLAEDRDGNLWLGTPGAGLMRLAQHGVVTYNAAGLPEGPSIAAIIEDARSQLHVLADTQGRHALYHFDGSQLQDVTPGVLARLEEAGRETPGREEPEQRPQQLIAAEPDGDCWVATAGALMRFPRVEHAADLRWAVPKAIYPATPEMGEISRLFRDARGDLWVGSLAHPDPARPQVYLSRWERATGILHPVPEVDRLGLLAPAAFAEDGEGNLWIGFHGGGLVRLRGERAEAFLTTRRVPTGSILALHVDRRHRLWVATAGAGALRVEGLSAREPLFTSYTSANGLASDSILSVTEDDLGRIYLGTGRGIDQLDPATGGIHTLTIADGLPSPSVPVSLRAHDGSLWFGTPRGLARYLPRAEPGVPQPPVVLTGVKVNGTPLPVPALGGHDLGGLDLAPGRNQLEIEFAGLSLSHGTALRYQYRLAGHERRGGWSAPAGERSVLLGNLAPGSYRFVVRAVAPGGTPSAMPASLSFTLLPPLWRRWWFLAGVAAASALLGWAGAQARTARLVALERVRTRIAADLHDDLSSSLHRISILSEVGKRRLVDGEAAPDLMDTIGQTARELMESTSDIVWAIDARRDDLESLLARIRRFASDLLEARGVELRFEAPAGAHEIALRPEAKRDLYLILKEALHNAARHARPRSVLLRLALPDRELVAEVIDDGIGFLFPPVPSGLSERPGPPGAHPPAAGDGLRNMRQRAERIGARLTVDSQPGAGTRVRLRLRL